MPNELKDMNNHGFSGGGWDRSGYGGGSGGMSGTGRDNGGSGYTGYSRPGQPGGYSTPWSGYGRIGGYGGRPIAPGTNPYGPYAHVVVAAPGVAPTSYPTTAPWRNLNLENALDPYRAYYSLDATRGTDPSSSAPPSISQGYRGWNAGENWGNFNGNNNYGTSGSTPYSGYANGGRPPVNQPSLVGENGPETFVPDKPGTIIPNNGTPPNGGGNGGGIVNNGTQPNGINYITNGGNGNGGNGGQTPWFGGPPINNNGGNAGNGPNPGNGGNGVGIQPWNNGPSPVGSNGGQPPINGGVATNGPNPLMPLANGGGNIGNIGNGIQPWRGGPPIINGGAGNGIPPNGINYINGGQPPWRNGPPFGNGGNGGYGNGGQSMGGWQNGGANMLARALMNGR